MASIHKEQLIDAPPDRVWDAIRDVGAIHTRLARDFVTDTTVVGDCRLVTFANGMVVRERIVDLNDRDRRIAYAVVESDLTHHNASIQIFADGARGSRLVWITDLLPDSHAEVIGGMMDQGCVAIKRTLETASV